MSEDQIPVEQGCFVLDKEAETEDSALLIKVTSANLEEWDVEDGKTVADMNPDYDTDQKTALIVWQDRLDDWDFTEAEDLYMDAVNKSIRFYAFPINRLERACQFCGEKSAEHTIFNPNIQTEEDHQRSEEGDMDKTWHVCTSCRDYIAESQQDMAERAIYNALENLDSDSVLDELLKCLKCGQEFEKIEDYPGGENAGLWEPACDCQNLENMQLSIG